MISYHEEHITRKRAGYTLDQWYELEPQERAFEVAIQRVEYLVDRHVAEASKQ